MIELYVHKKNTTVKVAIMPYKGTNTYSFVNLSRGHICNCKFNSEEEALLDLERQKEQGKIISYHII